MPVPVALPRLAWGDPASERRALLVHGLGSNAALMWRYGTALAAEGWHAEAVDLRGHGLAPRALDYTIDAYATDLALLHPSHGRPWDLVVGHSLGGAATTVAASRHPRWARRLVLVDPAIHLSAHDRDVVRRSQEEAFADPTAEAVRAAHPQWHPHDIELKALSAQQASRWAVEQTSEQNPAWDVREAAAALTTPTHIIGADPAVYSIFAGPLAAEVLRNPAISMSVVEGAGQNLDCIMLPKVQTAQQVVALDLLLTQIEKTMGFEVGKIGIEAQIENAQGLNNVNEIATASPRVETIIFGPADFMASINMKSLVVGEQPPGYPADAYHYILMKILMAARANNLQAIDGPPPIAPSGEEPALQEFERRRVDGPGIAQRGDDVAVGLVDLARTQQQVGEIPAEVEMIG